MRRLVLTALGALTLTTFVACGDNAPAAAPAPAPKPKKAAIDAAASADGGTADSDTQYVYVYNPVGKRDPFRAESEGPKTDGEPVGGGSKDCSEPLCAFDIEQLALVGVVSGDANPIAMLEAPDKVGHIVRRNTRVGKQGGKVTAISSDCIVVTEYFQTPDGRVNPNKVNICVKKDDSVEKSMDLFNNKAVQ
ncbi:MAG: pilus assembly protein PilP [Myxococcaceae bacterium]